ncbi:hypothetical protein GCM10022255_094690 [Dactylosporangium darangshiense]|uniref:Glutamine synthetase n=1 Tax=Dactylosporangium darangshiense TaxID=579108 RepID=A0ABP8DQ58_9ACTN
MAGDRSERFRCVRQCQRALRRPRDEVLNTLEGDHGFLLEGGVFTQDLVDTWISYKRANEVDPVRLRPTPHEFAMYYDV